MSGAVAGGGDPVAELTRRAVSTQKGHPTPVYSYSSRGVADLGGFFAATIGTNPHPLVSLYDVHHHLGRAAVANARSGPTRWFFDSGNYEVHGSGDPWVLAGPPGGETWTPDQYVATARSVVGSGDVLVSFDDPAARLDAQVATGCALLRDATLDIAGVRRDLLVHPNGASPLDVADAVLRVTDQFDILGLTEKGMGLPWQVTAAYVRELRAALDAGGHRYIPLHVFGCLDPRTLPRLFLAGADIFDGLGWSRYFFKGGHAYYSREFEDAAPDQSLMDERFALRALALHNVSEMERLADDLRYAVSALDPTGLEHAFTAGYGRGAPRGHEEVSGT